MTRLLVRSVEGFPSFAATVLAAVRGQFVSSLLSMPYVAGSASNDMDSVTHAPLP